MLKGTQRPPKPPKPRCASAVTATPQSAAVNAATKPALRPITMRITPPRPAGRSGRAASECDGQHVVRKPRRELSERENRRPLRDRPVRRVLRAVARTHVALILEPRHLARLVGADGGDGHEGILRRARDEEC